MKKQISFLLLLSCFASALVAISSCQKLEKPALSDDYPKDPANPGGTLNFYAAFDGTGSDAAMNGVDSIKANFPADNPLTSINGIKGKGVQGESKKFIKYSLPNDWALKAKSFTISFWIKRNGQTQNNIGTNGPEFPFSFKSSNGHWSGGNMFLLLEGNNTACAVKMVVVAANMNDNWMVWEGGRSIAGLLDNNWHHLAFVYEASTSRLTFYKDGVANAFQNQWGTHGDINISSSAISEFRIGCGPGTNYNSDDWLSSSWKGGLDQFRMYSKALSASEITSLFESKL